MKSYCSNSLMRGLALTLFFGFPVFGQEASASTEPVLDNLVGTMPIPAEIDHRTAMNTCVDAAIGREWSIVSKGENQIKINLRHRSWDATVYFVVKDDVIEAYSDSYEVNKKTGERKKKKDPDGWIKYLIKDINLLLAIAATEIGSEQSTEPVLDNPVGTIAIPTGIDREGALNTCTSAAIGRGWKVVSKEDNLIKINLKHRSWNATMYFVVEDETIEMYSDTYVVNKRTGERDKKKDPDGWIKNLKKDIESHFDKILYLE